MQLEESGLGLQASVEHLWNHPEFNQHSPIMTVRIVENSSNTESSSCVANKFCCWPIGFLILIHLLRSAHSLTLHQPSPPYFHLLFHIHCYFYGTVVHDSSHCFCPVPRSECDGSELGVSMDIWSGSA